MWQLYFMKKKFSHFFFQNAHLGSDMCTDCTTFFGDIDGMLTNQTVQVSSYLMCKLDLNWIEFDMKVIKKRSIINQDWNINERNSRQRRMTKTCDGHISAASTT